jgi:hypothetical protein
MATDLNIHRKSKFSDGNSEEDRARNFEVHNRERTWLVCYALDRSISAQMGKPYGIREECVRLVVYLYSNHHQFPAKPGELSGACDFKPGTDQLPGEFGCFTYTVTSSGTQRNGACPRWLYLKMLRSLPML